MASTRLRTGKLSSAQRTTTARLLLLCLYAIVLCILLGWLGLMLVVTNGLASEASSVSWTTINLDAWRTLLRVSLAAAVMVGPTIVPLVGAIRMARAGGRRRRDFVRLEPTDAPELWAMVAELDSSLGTRMNRTSIWLTPRANADVTVSPPRGRPRAKSLFLGVPLLAGLDREELRAVLCHELAHCAGRHHNFGVLSRRGSKKLDDLAEELDSTATVSTGVANHDWLLWLYARALIKLFHSYRVLYDRITRSARHRQEYEADQVAARHVGRGVMRRALLRADQTVAAWKTFRRASTSQMSQDRLEELYRSLGNALPARTGQRSHRPEKEHTSSHPPLSQRLAALGAGQEDTPASTGAPSLQILSSTDEGTGTTRWPKLPDPVRRPPDSGRRPQAKAGRRPRAKVESAFLGMSLKVLTTILTALLPVTHIIENWPW
ncbi:M48 family metallopeptidase [Streptomyces sp. NPDC048295]|uniref:M48 family metallopeptidase n=1 Tax=Streptomyces sp. NPDC048295 TaxID=3154617 RepID=UPI0034481D29